MKQSNQSAVADEKVETKKLVAIDEEAWEMEIQFLRDVQDDAYSEWDGGLFSMCERMSATPWGIPDSVDEIAPGIAQVESSGHGGLLVAPELNRLIPKYMRSEDGWYEEDVELAIVVVVFSFRIKCCVRDGASWVDGAHETMREDLPNEYRRWQRRDARIWGPYKYAASN
jgi:hypothetical protein